MVHGFGISFNIWNELAPFLQPHFSLILIELPGINQSPLLDIESDYLQTCVDGVEHLRMDLGIEEWIVLGYSTGSRIAEAYIQAHAASVQQAIFLCPLQVDLIHFLGLQFAFWVDAFSPALANWVLRGARLRFLISLFGFNLRPDPHLAGWYQEISRQSPRVLKETVRIIIPHGRNPHSVPVPYSSLWADADMVTVKPHRLGSRDHFVHANHSAPVGAADQVAAAIIQILQPQQNEPSS